MEPTRTNDGPSPRGFCLWWPQTYAGRQLWLFLLLVSAAVAAVREYLMIRDTIGGVGNFTYKRGFDLSNDGPSLLLPAAVAAAAWYILLVVIRYVAVWIANILTR